MRLPLLYSKLLFAAIGLLFVGELFGQDTLNQYDKYSKKHGWWVVTEKSKHPLIKVDTIEIGFYTHGKMEGIHISFYPENIRGSIIEYSNGIKNGKYILFDSRGCIVYKANYKNDMLSGPLYIRDSCNGDFTISFYDSLGKISGSQYIYEEWGTIKWFSYFENGKIIYKAKYDTTGKLTNHYGTIHDSLLPPDTLIKVNPTNYFNDSYLKLQMEPLIYNCFGSHIYKSVFEKKNKQITEDGVFRDGKLWNGKKYIYDKNGLLDKIEIWKNGKYAGDAEID